MGFSRWFMVIFKTSEAWASKITSHHSTKIHQTRWILCFGLWDHQTINGGKKNFGYYMSYPSSHNHGSVENGSLPIGLFPFIYGGFSTQRLDGRKRFLPSDFFQGWRTWSLKNIRQEETNAIRMKLKQSEGQEKCTFNQLARLRNVSAPLLWGDKCWLTKKWNTWLQKMKFCDIEGDIQDVLQWSNPFRMIYSWVNTSPFDLDGVEKERPLQRGRTSFKDIIVPTNSCLGSSRSQCMCRIGVIWYAWFMIDCCWEHRRS